ncbi:U-box domain-containing protein 7-like [Diospyros lotus]|uniref:U-box domain-containing protein 7-like n=1 Tax=Diospyros lotus TaxID=55363 RepID=UPI002253F23D|nr:U-box domain-containing protein 7-like [Diospyros lotus]
MGKYHRNDVGSLVLDHRPAGGGNSRLWASFSGASFRRIIVDAMRCGGGGSKPSVEAPRECVPKQEEKKKKKEKKKNAGSEKLSELLRMSESSEGEPEGEGATAEEVKKKVEALEEMKAVVKRLQNDDVLAAAIDVRRLTKEDSEARTNLALLGAIPSLVGLLDSEDVDAQIASLYALLNLAIGNDANKAAIVKAGAVHKMLKLIDSPNGSPGNLAVAEAVVANFLGLSALDSNKPIIGSSGAIPFLVRFLKELDKTSGTQAKQDSLRALYNLSISPMNVPLILETNLVPFLFAALGDMEVSERILSILSNVVSTPEGRKTVSTMPDAFPILIDVLNWTDSIGCQEKSSYILMIMAHKSYRDRQVLIEAGIVSSLLELTLLGSPLAQKRASRILEILRVDKGKQVSESFGAGTAAAVSAPLCGSSAAYAGPNHQSREPLEVVEDMISEERKAVKQLVQQSLQNNMRRIVKRANLPQDFVPSDHFKSLTTTSTSKSLPF